MLSMDDSQNRLPRDLRESLGGFAWWYLDWVGDDDTSVVLIPCFGLPFLPGYASAARRGQAPRAGSLPSLSVAVTRKDQPSFYLLQRYAESDATWTDDGMQMGDSFFRSTLAGDRREFVAELDCPIPGTSDRLVGRVSMDVPAIRLPRSEAGVHRWTPLGIGEATVDLRVADRVLASDRGRAYHDRNGCPVPLEDLGIGHWIWGRAAFAEGELIHYVLWPEGGEDPRVIGLWVDRDGTATELNPRVRLAKRRMAWFGMPWWRTLELDLPNGERATIHTHAVIDDGPFYLRFHTRVDFRGESAVGVAEAVRPSRVDGDLMRPLVSMAVHDLAGANSMWLPLFAGERSDRFARLLGRRALPAPVESTS